jgi:hypothetical protein
MKGSCLCGAVTFEAPDKVTGLSACHCSQCRKQSGHFWASASAPETQVDISGEVRWFEASSTAKRGFCPVCGSFLFWKAHEEQTMSFALGAIDGASGQKLERHIFTADKGDYHNIADGLPQKP